MRDKYKSHKKDDNREFPPFLDDEKSKSDYNVAIDFRESLNPAKGIRGQIPTGGGRSTAIMHDDRTYIDENEPSSVSERLTILDKYVGKPIADYVRELFPELAEIERAEKEGQSSQVSRAVEQKAPVQEPQPSPLPEKAPALWAEAKEPGDTPPAFIQRHYAPWLGQGLTRADVRHLDPQLYMALSNWLRKNELPEGFDLPTTKEKNDRWVQRVQSGEPLPSDPAALHRLGAAMRHRQSSK